MEAETVKHKTPGDWLKKAEVSTTPGEMITLYHQAALAKAADAKATLWGVLTVGVVAFGLLGFGAALVAFPWP